MDRQQNETMQQYRGRQKREMNAANDALNLQLGEPIRYAERSTRFYDGMIDRVRPSKISRLEGEDLASFLAKEKVELDRQQEIRTRQEARDLFFTRQEAKDADAIRYLLEDGLQKIIDRLTPAEWSEIRKRLES